MNFFREYRDRFLFTQAFLIGTAAVVVIGRENPAGVLGFVVGLALTTALGVTHMRRLDRERHDRQAGVFVAGRKGTQWQDVEGTIPATKEGDPVRRWDSTSFEDLTDDHL